MNWSHLFEPDNTSRICFTLLHTLWQVALAALIAAIVSRLWRKTSVEWNYSVHLAALIASLAAVPLTYSWLSTGIPQTREAKALPSISLAIPADTGPITATRSSAPAPREQRQSSQAEVDAAIVSQADFIAATRRTTTWQRMTMWLAGIYALGVAAMLLRLVIGVVRTERLRKFAITLQDGPAVAALNRIVQRWQLRTIPVLAQAERIVVPTVIGFVRPMILLPVSVLSGLTANELELILAHELAHVRRLDMWVNLLQRLAEAVLFFNPALWYLSRRIASLREYCCDERACRDQASRSAVVQTAYAVALLRVVELAKPSATRNPNLAELAASGNSPSELRRRIARLVGEPLSEPLRVSRGGLFTAVALAIAFMVGPVWLRSDAKTPMTAQFPPPLTDDDHAVVAARARTFGLQKVPRISFRETFWSADVPSMKKIPENSLKKLWQARSQPVDETMAATPT